MTAKPVVVLPSVTVMLVWGSTFVITKSAVAEVPPLPFAFLRCTEASAPAFWLWNQALVVFDVGQATAFINLVPLVGVVSAAVVRWEPLRLTHLSDGGLILLGVAPCLGERRARERDRTPR